MYGFKLFASRTSVGFPKLLSSAITLCPAEVWLMTWGKSSSPLRARGGWQLPPPKPWLVHAGAFRELMLTDHWAALLRSNSCPLLSYFGIFHLKIVEFLKVEELLHLLHCGENRGKLHCAQHAAVNGHPN